MLVGSGVLEETIQKKIYDLKLTDKVIMTGQVEDSSSYYSAFDIFVLPSLYEGLGLVGIEAQRSGLQCVFSDTITREVDITGRSKFLPITESEPWIKAILSFRDASKLFRKKNELSNSFNIYNIKESTSALVEYYFNLVRDKGGKS